jgi:hypothetical protein
MKTAKAVPGSFAGCRFEAFSFGSIRINGVTYEHDVVIDRGQVRKRKKKPSKKFREAFGGKDPVEMQATSHWHRHGRPAGHGRSEKGSQAPPYPVVDAADSQGD